MVMQQISNRFTTRSFADKAIPEDTIKEILKAGLLAPSWINTQPWHFIVVTNPRNKALLSQLAHGQKHVENAPVVVICCGDKSAWEKENFRKTMEERGFAKDRIDILLNNSVYNPSLISEQSVLARTLEQLTYAVSYMTLEAQNQGVESCVVGAIGNDFNGSVPEVYDLVRKTFELPDELSVMSLLLLGYPQENPPELPRIRKPFEEKVSFRLFGG